MYFTFPFLPRTPHVCHGFPLRAHTTFLHFSHTTTWKRSPLSQPTIHYHYQLCLLTGCISQQRHSHAKSWHVQWPPLCQSSLDAEQGGASIPLTRAKCLVSDPSSQWPLKRSLNCHSQDSFKVVGEDKMSSWSSKKTPLTILLKTKIFHNLPSQHRN